MTAFSPGTSPPPVKMPMRCMGAKGSILTFRKKRPRKINRVLCPEKLVVRCECEADALQLPGHASRWRTRSAAAVGPRIFPLSVVEVELFCGPSFRAPGKHDWFVVRAAIVAKVFVYGHVRYPDPYLQIL